MNLCESREELHSLSKRKLLKELDEYLNATDAWLMPIYLCYSEVAQFIDLLRNGDFGEQISLIIPKNKIMLQKKINGGFKGIEKAPEKQTGEKIYLGVQKDYRANKLKVELKQDTINKQAVEKQSIPTINSTIPEFEPVTEQPFFDSK